jgi:hypothetical protein
MIFFLLDAWALVFDQQLVKSLSFWFRDAVGGGKVSSRLSQVAKIGLIPFAVSIFPSVRFPRLARFFWSKRLGSCVSSDGLRRALEPSRS